ncbi:MAG: hypothetical protein Q8920_12320 [Bacillota bacterium]|nr:hypothetical protein [Bacillota bacterium]
MDATTISLVFFIASIALLIVYSFMLSKDLLLILGTGIFILAVIVAANSVISSFMAILIAALMLVIFAKSRRILHCLAIFFALLGGILTSLTNNSILLLIFMSSSFLLFIENPAYTGEVHPRVSNKKARKPAPVSEPPAEIPIPEEANS